MFVGGVGSSPTQQEVESSLGESWIVKDPKGTRRRDERGVLRIGTGLSSRYSERRIFCQTEEAFGHFQAVGKGN